MGAEVLTLDTANGGQGDITATGTVSAPSIYGGYSVYSEGDVTALEKIITGAFEGSNGKVLFKNTNIEDTADTSLLITGNSLTANTIYLPDSSGTLALSVNGSAADATGNITLDGLLRGVTSSGGTQTWLGMIPIDYGSASVDHTVIIGVDTGLNATNASYAIFIGAHAAENATDASTSNFIGKNAGYDAVNSNKSNFIGLNAGSEALYAGNSVLIGTNAGINVAPDINYGDLDGNFYSNFIGYYAGSNATYAYVSNFIGHTAGQQATNASGSNFFGTGAGFAATSASNSNFIGSWAGFDATNAQNANFIGLNAGQGASNASFSNFFGQEAGDQAYDADHSNFIGHQSGYHATGANHSNMIGFRAGYQAVNAVNSIFIGNGAGLNDTVNNTSGTSTSILIGQSTSTGGNINSIAIGMGTANNAASQLNIANVLYGTNIYSSISSSSAPVTGGKIGILNNNPSYTLHVGTSSISGIVARFQNSTGTCDINPTTSSLSCSSDQTLKKNITELDNTILDRVLALRPVTYNWKTESDTASTHIGFIAQEVESIFPDLVSTDANTGLKSVAYSSFIPYTIKAIQEMNVKVAMLPDFEDQTLSAKISEFLSGVAQGTAKVQKVETESVTTNELCMNDGGEKVCITPQELKTLLQSHANTASQQSPQSEPIVSPEPVIEEAPSAPEQEPLLGNEPSSPVERQ